MRQNHEKQLPITLGWPDHDLSQELRVITDILDSLPGIYDKALEDITGRYWN